MVKKYLKRFPHAFRGIGHALKNDFGYQWQVYGIGLFLIGFIYMIKPLSQMELLFIGLAYALILITELQNSSFEAALDRIHPDWDERVGRSKDMAAGAVLTAGFFLVFVVLVILFF